MTLALRIAGWGLFVVGMGLFIWAGGFSGAQDPTPLKRTLSYAGIFGALGGMVCTSLSRLLSHFEQQRRFKQKMRERTQNQWGGLKPIEKPPGDIPK